MSNQINISRFSRSSSSYKTFQGQALDMFDPFDSKDVSMLPSRKSLDWIMGPPRMTERPMDKFRLTVPLPAGLNKEDIDLRLEGQKLFVGDKRQQQTRKQFDIPINVDPTRMTSFLTTEGTLVAEIPFLSPGGASDNAMPISSKPFQQQQQQSMPQSMPPMPRRGSIFQSDLLKDSFEPRVVMGSDGQKGISMDIDLHGFEASQIELSVKDRDLILIAEHNEEDSQHSSRKYIYRQVTLPPSTVIDQMKSTFDNGHLTVHAPVG